MNGNTLGLRYSVRKKLNKLLLIEEKGHGSMDINYSVRQCYTENVLNKKRGTNKEIWSVILPARSKHKSKSLCCQHKEAWKARSKKNKTCHEVYTPKHILHARTGIRPPISV